MRLKLLEYNEDYDRLFSLLLTLLLESNKSLLHSVNGEMAM